MASAKTEAKVEFSAEISGFQKSINTLRKDITTLNNSLKLNAEKLKNNSSNVELLTDRKTLLNEKLEKSSQKVEALNNKLQAQIKEFGEDSNAVRTTTNELIKAQTEEQAIKNELEKVNIQLEEVTDSFKENTKEVETSKTVYEKLKDTISDQKDELSKLKERYSSVVLEQGKNSSEAKELKSQINDLNTELAKNEKVLKEVDDAASGAANGGFSIFKGVMSDLTATFIKECISGLKELGKEVIGVGKDFTSAMSEVKAISGATDEEFELLKQKAKEMGAATKFSAAESADALKYMAMAGWKTQDMVAGLDGIMNLAAASGEELGTTSDIVTDALTAFGLSADKSSHFADLLAAASSNSNTNVSMMGETFKYAASIAGSLGYSAEDTALAISLMANSGIKASQAGTSLRSIMSRLATDTNGARSVVEKMGIKVVNTDGSMRNFGDVINDLRVKFKNLSAEEQSNIAKTVAGQNALSGFLAIVNSGDADFEKLKNAINNCDGAALEMSKTMQNNLEGDLTIQHSLLEGLGLSLFDDFESPLRSVMQFINNSVLSPLISLNEKTGLVTAAVIALGSALAVLAGALAISMLIKGVTKAFALLNSTLFANPITWVVAAIVGLVAGFMALWKHCEGFRNFFIGMWEGLKNAVSNFFDYIVTFYENIKNGISNIIEFLSNCIENIKIFISEGIDAIVSFITNFIQSVIEFITNLITNIYEFFSPVIEFFSNIFNTIFENLKIIIDNIIIIISFLWNGITNIFSIAIEWFRGIFNGVVEVIKSVFTPIIEWFKGTWTSITNIFSVVIEWFRGLFNGAVEAIKSVFTPILEWFSGIWNSITEIFSSVSQWFGNIFTSAWENIKRAFSSVSSFFTGIFNTIKNIFQKIGTKVGEVINGAIKGAINGIMTTAEKVLNMPINAINSLIGVINKVPGISLSKLNTFNLPRLKVGMEYVPHDYYGPVYLDEGERVLTKEENERYSDNLNNNIYNKVINASDNYMNTSNSNTFNFYGNYQFQNQDDIDYFMNEAALKLVGVR